MTSAPLEQNLEVQVDPMQEYRVLIRSLKYTQGFGLLFVQCSPAEGNRIIAKVRQDLPQKQIEVLGLKEAVDTLYDKIEALSQRKSIDVLFVQGIEHSLYAYEQTRLWNDASETRNYSETAVPRLLQHLNLSRERMRDNFPFHLVFLVPHFALKYLARRAPDFFDWNSGVLEFALDDLKLHQESMQATYGAWGKDDPWEITPEDLRTNLLKVQALIEEPNLTAKQKSDLFLEQGRLLEISGELEEAIASYNKVLEINLDNDAVWNNRGNALANLGRCEEAITNYDKALKINPNHDSIWYNRGSTLEELGHHEEAIASFDKALEIKLDHDLAWNNRGNALARLKRYEDAIASFDKALELKPDHDLAWNNRGLALKDLGYYEEAIASFDKALKSNPGNNVAWSSRGFTLAKLKRYEEAIASYDKALKIKSDEDLIWYNRGVALGNLGRYEEAIASFDKALELKPDDAAWSNRGVYLRDLGRYEEAITSFDKALELNPDFDIAWQNRGITLVILGHDEEAIASFDRALELNPDFDMAWYNRGIALVKLGRYEEAIDSFDKALEFKPDNNSTWFYRSIALGELGRYEEAIASYDKALELKPDNDKAWQNRGVALGNLGRYEEAIASYDKVLEFNPQALWIGMNRAELKFALELADNALVFLENEIKSLKQSQRDDESWQFEIGLNSLFQNSQETDYWAKWLFKIIHLFDHHDFINALTQGLTEQSKNLVTDQVSQTTAESWRDIWQELVSDRDEFQTPLRLLNAVVEYKKAPDDPSVLLSLPIEERNTLKQLLDIQNH